LRDEQQQYSWAIPRKEKEIKMKIALTGLSMAGAYFVLAFLTGMVYASRFDMPSVEVGQSVVLWLGVAVVGLITWAKVD
jgi:hypothetical protein